MNTVNYSFKLGLRGLEHSQKKNNEKKNIDGKIMVSPKTEKNSANVRL